MIDGDAVENVVLVAKRIMEHECLHNSDVDTVDDREHIPRMERIADSVRHFLSDLGLASEKCDEVHDVLIQHARELYVAEWMEPLPGDDEPPTEKDAIREFDRHLQRKP